MAYAGAGNISRAAQLKKLKGKNKKKRNTKRRHKYKTKRTETSHLKFQGDQHAQ